MHINNTAWLVILDLHSAHSWATLFYLHVPICGEQHRVTRPTIIPEMIVKLVVCDVLKMNKIIWADQTHGYIFLKTYSIYNLFGCVC